MVNAIDMQYQDVTREGGDITAADMVDPPILPSQIQEFYKGSVIFITGGTGFMGKILLEKLLRSCPGISKIYLLMRPKKGKDIAKRFEEQFEGSLFERLKRERPKFASVVVPVNGDCVISGLGLSQKDRDLLMNEVTIVFHCAATVRFDEKLRVAANINVRSTKDILDLAQQMKQLKAMAHISTAYSNCPEKEIEEKFYNISLEGDKLLALVDALDDRMLETLTPVILGDWPNTYAYTKSVAENIIKQYGKGLPLVMVRPSQVIASSKEPVAGWINNMYGATGVVVGAATGLLRSLHCEPDNIADLVPVDFVINAMIAATWDIGKKTENSNNEINNLKKNIIPIYNYVGGIQKPITWRQFMKKTEIAGEDCPSPLSIWAYCFRLNSNRLVHLFFVYFLQFLPALIIDGATTVIGKKPILYEAYKKIHKFSDVISYFSTRQWKFHNDNVQNLYKIMAPRDKEMFNFDMSGLKWDEYFYTYVRGMRVYLVNDPLETIPQGKRKRMILKIAHYSTLTVLIYLFYFIFSTIFKYCF